MQKGGTVSFDISYEPEKRKGKLAYQTAGIDDIANIIILKPRDYQSDPTKQLADQIEKDGSSKMTASDMQSLAELVMNKSNESHQEIGGKTQVAIYESGKLRIYSGHFMHRSNFRSGLISLQTWE